MGAAVQCVLAFSFSGSNSLIPKYRSSDLGDNGSLLKNTKVQYFADITIGDQTFPAIYDTGSFEILVLSTRCERCISFVYFGCIHA